MTHGPGHGEHGHGEHSDHPFDRQVAMTMVVIAAILAGVKLLGHRAHNDTLNYQILAGVFHTQESDQWNFFQAKKNRQNLYEVEGDLLKGLGGSDKADLVARAAGRAAEYKKDAEEIKTAAEELKKKGEVYQHKSEHAHHQAFYYDIGELLVELSLVLCSVAILTKRRMFYGIGVGVGLVGAAVAAFGYFGVQDHGINHGDKHDNGHAMVRHTIQ